MILPKKEAPLFEGFPKIPRLSRECIITEKIDGTNASILITTGCETLGPQFLTGSRTRWITPDDDNHGFSRWAHEHQEELMALGPGHHFGEWWGAGIQRGYGLKEKRFSLFNTSRWSSPDLYPECCYVVPVLYQGLFSLSVVDTVINELRQNGSRASPGFKQPEGIVLYHVAAQTLFKKTVEHDDEPKNAHLPRERKPQAVTTRNPNLGGRRKAELPYDGPNRRLR